VASQGSDERVVSHAQFEQEARNVATSKALRHLADQIDIGVYDVRLHDLNPHTIVFRKQHGDGVILASIDGSRYTLTVELTLNRWDE
jgi:hypothetical protein